MANDSLQKKRDSKRRIDEWNLSLCVISLGAYLEKDSLQLYEEPLMKDAQNDTI